MMNYHYFKKDFSKKWLQRNHLTLTWMLGCYMYNFAKFTPKASSVTFINMSCVVIEVMIVVSFSGSFQSSNPKGKEKKT